MVATACNLLFVQLNLVSFAINQEMLFVLIVEKQMFSNRTLIICVCVKIVQVYGIEIQQGCNINPFPRQSMMTMKLGD